MSIVIKNISFVYNPSTPFEKVAVNDVNLTIEKGEFIGIMGHTGCGKSTIAQLITGLVTPSKGTIEIDGENINDKQYDRSQLRKKVGIAFQYPEQQLFETSVEKDVAFGLKHLSLSKESMLSRVKWALEITGFNYDTIRKQSPFSLSGGEKRKVAIAGVLATKPDYLILDEPIAGLDPLGREDFLKLITTLNDSGMTIIMISHNADSLGEFARRILVFNEGALVDDGTPMDIFQDVDKMKSRKLGVSQSREIAYLMNENGIKISQNITKYKELLPAVLEAINGGDTV